MDGGLLINMYIIYVYILIINEEVMNLRGYRERRGCFGSGNTMYIQYLCIKFFKKLNLKISVKLILAKYFSFNFYCLDSS